MQTAEGVVRLQLPQGRGLRAPYRSPLWAARGRTSEGLTRLIVEMSAGGLSQRDLESALEKALGQFVGSQRAGSAIPERLPHAYAALRPRDLSGFDLASLCSDAVYEPLRRWGSQTGVLCVWGLGGDGRKGFLPLSTTKSERYARCREVGRDLLKRGLQTPVTITTDGAPGLIQAVDRRGPRSRRRRGWLQTRQHLHPQVPPQAWPACTALSAARRDAPTFAEGQRRQQALRAPEHEPCPAACRCLEDEAEARLKHLQVPARHRQYGRTSPVAERACEEERRRTTVLPHLWDAAS